MQDLYYVRNDFYVRNEGSIVLLTPDSDAAYDWCDEHLPEDAMRFGLSYVIEHRYADEILTGILGEGLTYAVR